MTRMLMNDAVPASSSGDKLVGALVENESSSSFFQQLLSTELTLDEDSIDPDASMKDLSAHLNDLPLELLKELYFLFVDQSESVNENEMVENLAVSIHELFANQDELAIPLLPQLKAGVQFGQQPYHEQFTTYFVTSHSNENIEFVQPDQAVIMKQFNEIFIQVESLLSDLSDKQNIMRASPMILELLEKWAALDHKYDQEKTRSNIVQSSSESETKSLTLWKELVNAFQKRSELAANQHYEPNAKVTVKDISRWLQNSLHVQATAENQMHTEQANLSNHPLSKVEQYVIYMNQNETAQSVDKQLVDQFQQVMRTSRFLSLNNGENQLFITLRPDNLGEMMVRFTEVNGEMTLKIIVSSQAAKQMLESNIHQLKHMFSPHQVVIEEREIALENLQSAQEEQGQTFDEEDHSHESSQEESGNFDENIESEFHEILMNEKV